MNKNTLQALCALEFEEIARMEQAPLFDAGRAFSRELQHSEGIPHQVFQYWNDAPDEQVTRLLEQTREHCEGDGIRWRLFNEQSAAAFLKDNLGDRYEAAFYKCVHQAQRSDFFRYCYLLKDGGMWLDADLTLIASPKELMSYDRPVFFQRLKKPQRQLTNWFMSAPPGNRIIAEIVKNSLANIENDTFFEERVRERDIASISGFWIVRRAVARSIHEHLRSGQEGPPPVKIIDEGVHDRFVQTAAAALGEALRYKRTERAWQHWQNNRVIAD